MIHLRGHETRKRSIIKAFSWRTLGSIDTFMLGWLFTGSATAAGAIASTEVLTKMVLYYLHERGWSLVNWGFLPIPTEPAGEEEVPAQ